jgi:hypothetical protein
MGSLMWHFSAISQKAAYGPQAEECVCNNEQNLMKWIFLKVIRDYKASISQKRSQKTKLKSSNTFLFKG